MQGLYPDLLKRSLRSALEKHGIDEEIVDIDGFGAYWRREA
jgi:hypothetical protein